MRHRGRSSDCSQHYLNYDAKVYNSSLPGLKRTCQDDTYYEACGALIREIELHKATQCVTLRGPSVVKLLSLH